jgi:homoserine dehydrogenase
MEDIYCEGVDNIEPEDLQYAGSLGYTLKLLAIGIKHDRMVELRVHPALLDHDHPLAAISGANNAVCVHGDSVGEVMLTGPGAGRWPTASAVVADISRLALGTYQLEFSSMAQFGGVAEAALVPQDQVRMRYYFRLSCLDRPGVLARVAGILGQYNISIDSCIQKGKASEEKAHVPVVFMTHMAREGDLTQALQSINELECIAGSRTRMLRVQDI